MHTLLNYVQLRLAHGAFEAEQQPVVVLRSIVNTVEIADESPEKGADLQELVPIFGRACKARHFHAQDHPHVAQAYLRNKTLKTDSAARARGGLAQVVVDEQDHLLGPTKSLGATHQAVLQTRGFLVIQNLLGGRLPDVDYGQPLAVRRQDLLRIGRQDFRSSVEDHVPLPPLSVSPLGPLAGAVTGDSSSLASDRGWPLAASSTTGRADRLRAGGNCSLEHHRSSFLTDGPIVSNFLIISTRPNNALNPMIGQLAFMGASWLADRQGVSLGSCAGRFGEGVALPEGRKRRS